MKRFFYEKFFVFSFVVISTIIIMGAVVASFWITVIIVEREGPLIIATLEVKLSLTLAHLWLEEVLAGDTEEDIRDVWDQIDGSRIFI